MHIAIAGNIGSGKSTLTRLLARHYGWKPHYEQVAHNPYLEDYYRDIKRWSFPLEVFYLKERFKDLLQLQKQQEDIVQDRSIYEGVYVFTANNHDLGNLDDRDFANYTDLFDLMMSLVKLPDLLIYIRSSIPHLIEHIQRRGRDYEQTIRIDYLRGLGERYEEWIKTYQGPMIIVDGDKNDFLDNPADFQRITEMIDERLYGLFPLDNKD